jgi:branched-subunit amino acid transport protein
MNNEFNLTEPRIFELSSSDKSLMIDDKFIYYATAKKFYDVTEFQMSAKEDESVFNLVKKISLKDISKFTYEQEDNQTLGNLFYYNSKNKEEEYSILFEHGYDFSHFVDVISSKANLKRKEVSQSIWKAVQLNVVFTILSIALTALWFSDSLADHNGEHVSIGRGKGAIVTGVGIMLGRKITPWGILGIGTLLSLLCLYFLFKKYKNPPTDIVFEKY